MPSTATTGVNISTILDLIGPSAQSTSTGKEPSPFDALLQPPKSPPVAPPSSPTADSRHAEQQDRSNSQRLPPPAATSEERRDDSPQEASNVQPDSTADRLPTSPSNEEKADSEDNGQPNESQASETVIAEALAALAAITPVAAITTPQANADGAGQAAEKESVELASEPGKQKSGRRQTSTVQIGPAKPVADATQGDVSLVVVADSSSEAAGTANANASFAEPAAVGASVEALTNDARIEAATTVESLDGESIAGNGDDLTIADTSEQSTSSSQDQPRDNQQNNEPSTAKFDPAAAAPQTSDPSAATGANKTPAAVAQAAQISVSDAPQSTTNSTPTNSLTHAAPLRSRLPADVLTGPASSPQRRTNVEVDASRLITRVARAFSAAQERDGEIRLRLSPPELGSLRLDVRVQDGALVARLQTETDAARTAILDNLPALRERLSEQGIRIERFDVDLMQRQPGGMPDQKGGHQQDTPTAPVRLVSPPQRSRAESAAATVPTSASVSPAGGLNVIV